MNQLKFFMMNLRVLTLVIFMIAVSCSTPPDTNEQNGEDDANGDQLQEVILAIDRNTIHQTIDGFGFFGARNVWWTGDETSLFTEEWGQMIIEDLGLTIWRNEYYPPAVPGEIQDADWEKQKPVVEGIATAAENAGVDLKMIFTVWSPPADMKIAYTDPGSWVDRERLYGEPHPGGTKEGGALDPEKYEDFGNWLADGIQLYEELGIDIYAISLQNEPFFEQFFNSAWYHPEWYAEMLEAVVPVVKERYPEVKIFGAEGMLSMEAQPWFHHSELMRPYQESAREQLDTWAVHGYEDGVNPTGSIEDWEYNWIEYSVPTGKPLWMTETSGYHDHWLSQGNSAGALNLALNIHTALKYGNVSAWVWWQGSEIGDINQYNLMDGEANPGKRYYVSKQFYRYIRPGAQRVGLEYDEADGVVATAYNHTEMNAFTIVAVNTNEESIQLNLTGAGLPDTYDIYVTSSSQNTKKLEPTYAGDIVLPPQSIVTLVHGNVFEH